VSVRVRPELRHKVAEFGGGDIDACMNCGNCTAECPLSRDGTVFPRRIIRYLQLGLEDRLRESPEPWLCYYCGECSETCPREANPGETMMAARRWLTAQYDWTGISERLYTSKAWEVGLSLAVGLFVVALFVLFHGPVVTDHVELNTFAPVKWVEYGDWAMALILSFFLLTNAWRMHRFVMGGVRARPSTYLTELGSFLTHGLTQKRWRECGGSNLRWLKHFLLVTAYSTMLILILVFLRWFQTDGWHWTSLLGYYATAVLLYVTGDAMIGRLRKREELHKHSHSTDWMFLILLFLTALTGILVHLFRMGGLPLPTYVTYVIHLAVAVPMLVVEVPFGKWAHLLYRPLAIYLVAVRQRAAEASTEAVPAAA
jgi:ferredoxin